MLLIDEYDVPLEKAASSGYYEEMRLFLRDFLSILKPEDAPRAGGLPVLEKAVLSGSLPVSEEEIFPGVDHADTVLSGSASLSASIGFTEAEVGKLLNTYGLAGCSKDVKERYDGYQFGSVKIYCPWDVLNFCQDAFASNDVKTAEPDNYWINTGSNDAIDEFLGFLTEEDAGRMQTLLDGGSIELNIKKELSYADFERHESQDFWTLFLFAGYLTVEKHLGGRNCLLRIPNEEIRQTIRSRVSARFSSQNAAFAAHGIKLAEAAVTGNASRMAKVLEPLLRTYVAVRDAATRAPTVNYYHGFLSALFPVQEAAFRISAPMRSPATGMRASFLQAAARIAAASSLKSSVLPGRRIFLMLWMRRFGRLTKRTIRKRFEEYAAASISLTALPFAERPARSAAAG